MAAPPPRRKTLAFVPGREHRLVIAAQDLRLYGWRDSNDSKATLQLLTTNSEFAQMKCFALSHDPATPDLVAVGTSAGRVFLGTLAAPADARGGPGAVVDRREFSLRTSRVSNVLGFNPVFHNQLFQGLEKGRNECSLLVWDLNSHNSQAAAAAAAVTVAVASGAATPLPTPPLAALGVGQPSIFGGAPVVAGPAASASGVLVVGSVGGAPAPTPIRPSFDGRRMSSVMSRTPSLSIGTSAAPPSVTPSASQSRLGDDDLDGGSRSRPASMVMDPIKLFGQNESVSSAAWILGNPYYLAAGMSQKYIRLFDMRGDTSHVAYVNTKAVLGLQADPLREYRFASFGEDGMVKVWDARKLGAGALLSLQAESRQLIEIAWSPQRTGLLASAARDEAFLNLWELHDQPQTADDETGVAVPVLLRNSQTRTISDTLQSFAWHPTLPNLLVTLNRASVLENVKINSAPQIAWTPAGQLVCGRDNLFVLLDTSRQRTGELEPDVADEMRARAVAGYALNMDMNRDIAARAGRRELAQLWAWMSRSQMLFKTNRTMVRDVDYAYRGIFDIFCGTVSSDPSTIRKPQANVRSFPFVSDAQLPFDVYESDQRRLALLTCGWGSDDSTKDIWSDNLAILESQGEYERAALMSLFYLDLRRAISALNMSKSETLRLLALALAGYSNDGNNGGFNGLWKESVTSMVASLTQPYLVAMFGLLTSYDDFASVLGNAQLNLSDRLAFACRFLDDNELPRYIKETTMRAVEEGNLEGILLTGLTPRGVDLAAAYVNRTGDVQSAAILFAQAVPKKFKDERAEMWREIYRDLLDQWRLWHERATFDIACRKFNADLRPGVQAFVRCNFCGQLLSPATVAVAGKSGATDANARRRLPATASGSAPNAKSKSTVCPNPACRKPLPRCAICLLNLGSPMSNAWLYGDAVPSSDKAKAAALGSLSQWFSWCQTCRHGGHVEHMDEWFHDHFTCPVADCTCRCRDLDAVPGDR